MSDHFISRPALKFAPGELVFGYRLIRELGRGSFGHVWLATNDKGFEWALKIVSLVGSGGKKEFRALQLIKDRKIKSTHLLKLIDYGLLDRDGTSLAPMPAPVPAATPKIIPVTPPSRGTLVPGQQIHPSARTSIEHVAARDTQHNRQDTVGDETEDIHSRAMWLIIVMEVGDRTLHELQLDETKRELSQRAVRATRAVKRSGQTILGQKQAAQTTVPPPDPAEEPLVPLPIARVLPYIDQAARGLDYLHRNDILHRDVKPQNIMLVDADAKLCDYGLASEVRNSAATTEGCSPAYAAPEAINNRPVPASDQYSLAVTYVELISGRWPFFGTTQTAIYREKDEGRHNLTFIRNRRVRLVLARALAKHPDDRFPNCTEFAQQLMRAEQAPTGSRLKPALVMGGVTALALALAGTGFTFKDDIARLLRRPIVQQLDEPYDPVLELPLASPAPVRLHGSEVSLLTHSPELARFPKESPTLPIIAPAALVRPDYERRQLAAADRPPPRSPRAVPFRQAAVLHIRPPAPVPPLPKIEYRNADEELAALWQVNVNAPDVYLKRHIELVSKAQQPARWWDQLAERAEQQPQWLTEVEPFLMRWLAEPGSPIVRQPGFAAFHAKVQDLGVERMLTRELRTAADVSNALTSPAYVLNKQRLIAQTIHTEWELRTNAARPLANEADWLKTRIAKLQSPSSLEEDDEKGNPTWKLFRSYVLTLLYARSADAGENHAALAQLNVLLQPEQLPNWLSTQRRDLVRQAVGRAALAELKCTASDVPRFAGLKAATSAELKQLMQRAETHQLTSASLSAAQALASATEAESPPWPQIYTQATAALAQAETRQLLGQQDRLVLLEYVAALAQLKSGEPRLALDTAIDRLAGVLQAKQGTSQRYFNFADGPSAQDEGVLKNLLLPILEHPNQSTFKPQSPTTAANLAALWGAEGRLLQRNPALVAHLPGGTVTEATELAEALRRAHHAFDKARGFDSLSPQSAAYLVGYGTTLVARPSLGGARVPRDVQLIKVVQTLSSQNNPELSAHPGLLALQGHVQRMEGKLVAANDRYEKALASTSRAADPFFIREACLIGLCYSQVEQATLAPWSEPDFKHAALEPDLPLPGTKSYYLRRALEQAEEAEQSKLSLQREQIYLAKGFVLEQLASQLDCRAKYGEAQTAYMQALTEAQKANRPIAVCKLNMGRCYVLGVTDPAVKLEPSRKAGLLEEAIAALTAALGEHVDLSFEEAKRSCDLSAHYWRAVAQLELAKLDHERRRQLEAEAQRDLNKVLEIGKGVVSTEVGDAWRLLLWRARPQNGVHTTSSPLAERYVVVGSLKELMTEPGNFTPAAVLDIVEENRRLPATGQISFMSWFHPKSRLDDQWYTSNEWKLAGAKISNLASDNGVVNDENRNRANRLSGQIQGDEPKKNLALAFGYLRQLPLEVQSHESRQKTSGGGTVAGAGGGGQALSKEHSLGMLAVQFERAYVAMEQAVDPVSRQHLAELNKLPVEKLREKFEELDPLPRRIIREHLLREVTFDDRVKVNDLVRRANDDLSSPRLTAIAHNLLKPAFLLPIVDSENLQHAQRLEPLRKRLMALEIKLGIREEPKPKEAPAASGKSNK